MKGKKGFISKDLIISIIVLTLIWVLALTYLITAKKSQELKDRIEDLSVTIQMSYKKSLNTDENIYNLKKIFNEKGVFNYLKKEYDKDLIWKRISNKILGLIQYNNEDNIILGTDSFWNSNSFLSSKINKKIKDNEVWILIGIEGNRLTTLCSGYGLSSTDKVLTIYDTIQNSNGIWDPISDECRGGVDSAYIKSFILIFKGKSEADKFNYKYFERDWKVITITDDGTNNLYWLVIPLKNNIF